METDQVGRLHDILVPARLIAYYVKDTNATDFAAMTEKQDAIIRRIEIIDEATAHLTEETRRTLPELPSRKMRGMRNIVAHDYANVDYKSFGRSRRCMFLKSAQCWRNFFLGHENS